MPTEETLLRTRRFDVVRLTYRDAAGHEHIREFARHPGAVTILPVLDGNRVCLIRNVRQAVGQTLLELPAGTLEPREDPRECALRELAEETGYRAGRIELLTEFFMSPGVLDERMRLFLATDLTPGETHFDSGEEIQNQIVDWDEAMRLVREGQIQDAKSLVGLLWYAARLRGF